MGATAAIDPLLTPYHGQPPQVSPHTLASPSLPASSFDEWLSEPLVDPSVGVVTNTNWPAIEASLGEDSQGVTAETTTISDLDLAEAHFFKDPTMLQGVANNMHDFAGDLVSETAQNTPMNFDPPEDSQLPQREVIADSDKRSSPSGSSENTRPKRSWVGSPLNALKSKYCPHCNTTFRTPGLLT